MRLPDGLGVEEIREHLSHLAPAKQVVASPKILPKYGNHPTHAGQNSLLNQSFNGCYFKKFKPTSKP
jgi:hypothetical protein